MARWWSKREASALRVHGGCTDTEKTCVACLRVVLEREQGERETERGECTPFTGPWGFTGRGATRGYGSRK